MGAPSASSSTRIGPSPRPRFRAGSRAASRRPSAALPLFRERRRFERDGAEAALDDDNDVVVVVQAAAALGVNPAASFDSGAERIRLRARSAALNPPNPRPPPALLLLLLLLLLLGQSATAAPPS